MNDYLIGSGALITAGPNASIAGAALHVQTDPAIAANVRAAVFDFESSDGSELSKILVLGAGWSAGRVREALVEPLLDRGTCTLAEILALLARAAGTHEVHLFARWTPDELLTAALARSGVTLAVHPLESIRQAALVSGHRFLRWPSVASQRAS